MAVVYTMVTSRASEQQRKIDLPKFILSPEKRKIWFVNMLLCLFSGMIGVLLIPYLQERYDADLEEIAITFLLPMLVSSFSGSFLGKLGDRAGYRKAIAISIVISCLTISTIVFSPRLSIFAVLWTIFIISNFSSFLSLDAMFFRGISEEHIGDASGKYSIGAYVGGIIGPALGGFVFDTYGSTVPYIIFAVSMALLVLLLFRVLPKDNSYNPALTTENQTFSQK
ncbi:MFS transporter [Paenibacillus solani]|uniref:MFS transporter n=1 Tax=Paenibacillus solani TaxID=1705565 RepID=UPI003D2DCAC3